MCVCASFQRFFLFGFCAGLHPAKGTSSCTKLSYSAQKCSFGCQTAAAAAAAVSAAYANFFSISVQCATAQRHKRPTMLLKLLKSLKWKFGLFITFTETVPLFVLLLLLLVLLLDNLKSEEEKGKDRKRREVLSLPCILCFSAFVFVLLRLLLLLLLLLMLLLLLCWSKTKN